MTNYPGFRCSENEIFHCPMINYTDWKLDPRDYVPVKPPMLYIAFTTTRREGAENNITARRGGIRVEPDVKGIDSFAWRGKYALLMEEFHIATGQRLLSCSVSVYEMSKVKYYDSPGWYDGLVKEAHAPSVDLKFQYDCNTKKFCFEIWVKREGPGPGKGLHWVDWITIPETEGLVRLPEWAVYEYQKEKKRFQRYFKLEQE